MNRAGSERLGTDNAAALAKLKGSPAEFNTTVKGMSPGQLSGAMKSAVREGGFPGWRTYDTSLAVDIINSAAASGEPAVKAGIFAQGAAVMNAIGGDENMKAALANLVKGDTCNSIAQSVGSANQTTRNVFADASADALRMGGDAKIILARLTGEQMGAVAQRLAAIPQNEGRSVYANIARTATGQQLAALTDAFPQRKGSWTSLTTFPAYKDFVSAIASNASVNVKVEYVGALAPSIKPSAITTTQGPGYFIRRYGDPQAEAAGVVLASLNAGRDKIAEGGFNAAIKSLTDDQLNWVMQNSTHVETHVHPQTADHDSYWENKADTTLTAAIVDAAANSGASGGQDTKVRVFKYAALAISYKDGIEGGAYDVLQQRADSTRIASALTNLMDSNTTGMMTALFKYDREMDSLVNFLEVKINNKQFDDVSASINKLTRGNGLEKPKIEFLSEQQKDENGNSHFVNQKSLGRFVGAVAAATKHVAASKKEREAITTNIMITLFWAGTAHHPADLQATAAAGSGYMTERARRKSNEIDTKYADWTRRLVGIAYVKDPDTGAFIDLQGNEAFQNEFTYIMARHP